jgi:Streptomycin adenylyltransferase
MSDLDLLVIVSDPSAFLSESNWLLTFGEPCLTFVEPTATGNFKERRAAFKDGKDVDFYLVPVQPSKKCLNNRFLVRLRMFLKEGLRFSWIKIVWRNGLPTVLVGLKKSKSYRPPRCGMKRDTISCITFFWQLRKPDGESYGWPHHPAMAICKTCVIG